MTLFADRYEAGTALADRVAALGLSDPLVLALPRGGVPVGYQVARRIGAELDVVVARKIGLPWRPELGIGAVSGDGPPVYDLALLHRVGLTPEELEPVLERERAEVRRRLRRYRGDRPPPRVAGRDVVVVDDGLATGVTARAALGALAEQEPARLVCAVPVCATEPIFALSRHAEVVYVHRLVDFVAVGRWYHDFTQVTDEEVVALLGRAREWREGLEGLDRPER